MKATEFVKKFGWDRAKREVDLIGTIAAMCCEDDFNNDLKRLVESYDLVEAKGGIKKAKKEANCLHSNDFDGAAFQIYEAIADVESCYD